MFKANNKDTKTMPNWLRFGVFICSSISFLNFENVSADWVMCLRLIYIDKRSSYEGFLRKHGSVSGHHENINYLLLSYWDVWSQEHFNHRDSGRYFYGIIKITIRNQNDFRQPLKTVYRGCENISFIGPKIWDNIPEKSKESISIDNFKSQSENGDQKTTPGEHM